MPPPIITFFGITRSDSTLVSSDGMTPDGIPIYSRSSGYGFSLVVEGHEGNGGGVSDGLSTFSPGGLPDLQIVVSRDLGNGSLAVCDDTPPIGGVPATDPVDFSAANANAINDLACRFKDRMGAHSGREDYPCTSFTDGTDHFASPQTTVQFCALIDQPFEFQPGDTLVTARVRDTAGQLSMPGSIVIRIATPVATP